MLAAIIRRTIKPIIDTVCIVQPSSGNIPPAGVLLTEAGLPALTESGEHIYI